MGEVEQLDWEGLLAALLDFQGYSTMIQVSDRHHERRHTPVLSAFGVLLGGVNDEAGGEMIALDLASSVRGSNGALCLRRDDFESAVRVGPDHLSIRYAGMDVGVAKQGDEPAELGPESGGLYRGRIA